MGSHGHRMSCGPGVPLCGVLTLQTGRGTGVYRSSEPKVHGLWPEVSNYGDSQCLPPQDEAPPQRVHSCYAQEGSSLAKQSSFQRHEWYAHGKCAGAQDADDYFSQVCGLAAAPLRTMAGARAADLDLTETAEALQRAGHCVWRTGTQAQVQLSACAGSDGRWKLADVAHFAQACGQAAPPAPAVPAPASSEPVCVHSHRGPKCKHDGDCHGLTGCLRCAHSGFCTDVPMPSRGR